jgi:hypothetical protein
LLDALRALSLGDARTGKSGLDRLAEGTTITKRDKSLKFFALDPPVIDRQIDAMHSKQCGSRAKLWNCDLGARIFMCDARFAGLAFLAMMQLKHKIIGGVA